MRYRRIRTEGRRGVMASILLLLYHGAPLAQSADRVPQLANQIRFVNQFDQDRILLRRSSYNYAPSVIHDGGVYHLYWCGGVAGDFILHAQATTLSGPWHSTTNAQPSSFDISLSPT